MKNTAEWDIEDFARAMEKAVRQHASNKILSYKNGKILFNGFWRDGDRQNICLWPEKATWHDAKTGDGGGCKEFAQTAFNLSLPEFMNRFSDYVNKDQSSSSPSIQKAPFSQKEKLSRSIDLIWSEMLKETPNEIINARNWFKYERGFLEIETSVGSGFICLNEKHIQFFEKRHQAFITHRLSLAQQLVVPLRCPYSHEVQNLFFRSITSADEIDKTRLLPNAGGWSEPDGTPRAFGFPCLINKFANLIICEGMADYMAAECLLQGQENYLPIGAANADALLKWALYLCDKKYEGHVTIVYHLDKDENGIPSRKKIGPLKAIQALALLRKNNINASLFNWFEYLNLTTTLPFEINDLADSLRIQMAHNEASPDHLISCFINCLND